jgi:hypothetical protein
MEVQAIQALLDTALHARSVDETSLSELWADAASVPINERAAWLKSQEGKDHMGAIAFELGHLIHAEVDNESGPHSIHMSIPQKKPRGLRTAIIATIAEQSGLPESSVDQLWQSYRARFKKV